MKSVEPPHPGICIFFDMQYVGDKSKSPYLLHFHPYILCHM